jgi:hypothetical protein
VPLNVREQETLARFIDRTQRLETQVRRLNRQLAQVFMLLIRSAAVAPDELSAALTTLNEAWADEDRREAIFYEELIRDLLRSG